MSQASVFPLEKMEVGRIISKKLIGVRYLLGIRHCLKCFLCQLIYPHNKCNCSLIMQLKKVRHREMKSSTRNSTAGWLRS